jgi:PleD family two-component response regulator
VIFPGVDYVSARTAVCRAQNAVARDPACLGVRLSWGLADLSAHDADTLLMRADAALYKAKGGRRRARAVPDAQRDQVSTGTPGDL